MSTKDAAPQDDSSNLYPVWVIVTTSDDQFCYVVEFSRYDENDWQAVTRSTDGLNLGRRRIDSIYPTLITWEQPDGSRSRFTSTRDTDHAIADFVRQQILRGLAR